MSIIPVSANVVSATITAAVTAAAGGAGDVIADTTNSLYVRLRNAGEVPCEYKVDSGSWLPLYHRSSAALDINLANSVIRVRKASGEAASSVALEIFRLQGGFSAGDEVVDPNRSIVNVQTGLSYTLAAADAGGQVDMSNAAPNTCNIPTNAVVPFPLGTRIRVCMAGAGITTIAGPGVTLVKPAARALAISAQYELADLHKVATDTWRVNAS